MRIGKPSLRDSFFGWLGGAASPERSDAQRRTHRIRERMLRELMQGRAGGVSVLARQIAMAADAQTLWYFRSELMQALSRRRGEAAAAATLAELTPLFHGLVPASLMPGGAGPRRR